MIICEYSRIDFRPSNVEMLTTEYRIDEERLNVSSSHDLFKNVIDI